MKISELICAQCGDSIYFNANKVRKEISKEIKPGKKEIFCSITCLKKRTNKNNLLVLNNSNSIEESDQTKSFEFLLLTINNVKNLGYCDLNVNYLKSLWEQQNGKCHFFGCDLLLPYSSSLKEKSPNQAVLDKLDKNKDYTIGNVIFISLLANIGRKIFSDTDLADFIKTK